MVMTTYTLEDVLNYSSVLLQLITTTVLVVNNENGLSQKETRELVRE